MQEIEAKYLNIDVAAIESALKTLGAEQIEIEVSDGVKATQILEKIGLTQKFLEEKRRIRYRKGDIEYDIDELPELPPFLEIEGPSWEAIDEAARSLGLDPEKKRIYSAFQMYAEAGIDMLEYKTISFKGMVKRANP